MGAIVVVYFLDIFTAAVGLTAIQDHFWSAFHHYHKTGLILEF